MCCLCWGVVSVWAKARFAFSRGEEARQRGLCRLLSWSRPPSFAPWTHAPHHHNPAHLPTLPLSRKARAGLRQGGTLVRLVCQTTTPVVRSICRFPFLLLFDRRLTSQTQTHTHRQTTDQTMAATRRCCLVPFLLLGAATAFFTPPVQVSRASVLLPPSSFSTHIISSTQPNPPTHTTTTPQPHRTSSRRVKSSPCPRHSSRRVAARACAPRAPSSPLSSTPSAKVHQNPPTHPTHPNPPTHFLITGVIQVGAEEIKAKKMLLQAPSDLQGAVLVSGSLEEEVFILLNEQRVWNKITAFAADPLSVRPTHPPTHPPIE